MGHVEASVASQRPRRLSGRLCAVGQELAGMVQMGEYSNGCICQVKGKTVTSSAAAAAIPAITGVVMQLRRAADQNATVNGSTGAH